MVTITIIWLKIQCFDKIMVDVFFVFKCSCSLCRRRRRHTNVRFHLAVVSGKGFSYKNHQPMSKRIKNLNSPHHQPNTVRFAFLTCAFAPKPLQNDVNNFFMFSFRIQLFIGVYTIPIFFLRVFFLLLIDEAPPRNQKRNLVYRFYIKN